MPKRIKPARTRDYALLFLNGIRHEVRGEKVGMMLADYLRYHLGLTGTKIVCAEGDCGACTVLRLFQAGGRRAEYYEPVNSCITTVGQMDGSSLLSIEYLDREGLDPVQKAMIECHGSQCGFCTPGFVMALKGLVDRKRSVAPEQSRLKPKEAQNALTGNLCRCTGYQQILDAAVAVPLSEIPGLKKEPWHSTMLRELKKESARSLFIDADTFSFFSPRSLPEAVRFLAENRDAKIIGAGTDAGVLVNKGKLKYRKLLSHHLISGLHSIKQTRSVRTGFRMQVGAQATLESVRRATERSIPEFSNYLALFASPQIKNVATLAGNVANASPIGDTLPFLLSMDAKLNLVSLRGERQLPLDKFFLEYRRTALKAGEIITSIEFDIPEPGETLFLYKTSQRKDLDISSVNGAIRFAPNFTRVALGGVAAVPIRIKSLEAFLDKHRTGQDCVQSAIALLQEEIHPLSDLRGSSGFRRLLAENFLRSSILGFQEKAGPC